MEAGGGESSVARLLERRKQQVIERWNAQARQGMPMVKNRRASAGAVLGGPPKSQHAAWRFFLLLHEPTSPGAWNIVYDNALCVLCTSTGPQWRWMSFRQSLSNLVEHIVRIHNPQAAAVGLVPTRTSSSATPVSATSRAEAVGKGKRSRAAAQAAAAGPAPGPWVYPLFLAWCRMHVPAGVVEDPAFRWMLQQLSGSSAVPVSTAQLTQQLQPRLHTAADHVVTEMLRQARFIGVSVDHSVAVQHDPVQRKVFLSMAFVDAEGVHHCLDLACGTAPLSGVSDAVWNTLRSFQIDHRIAHVTLASSADATDVPWCPALANKVHLQCTVDMLSHCVTHALDHTDIHSVVQHARALARLFTLSPDAADALRQHQTSAELLVDAPDQRCSTFFMLERVVQLRDSLGKAMRRADVVRAWRVAPRLEPLLTRRPLSLRDLTILECLVDVLRPFVRAIDELQGCREPAIYKVLMVVRALAHYMQVSSEDDHHTQQVKQVLRSELAVVFPLRSEAVQDPVPAPLSLRPRLPLLLQASYLARPILRLRYSAILAADEVQQAQEHVVSLAVQLGAPAKEHLAAAAPLSAPSPVHQAVGDAEGDDDDDASARAEVGGARKRRRRTATDDFLAVFADNQPPVAAAQGEDSSTRARVLEEMALYEGTDFEHWYLRQSDDVPQDGLVALFWRQHVSVYPLLSQCAQWILTCRASAVAPSAAAAPTAQRQGALLPDNLDDAVIRRKLMDVMQEPERQESHALPDNDMPPEPAAVDSQQLVRLVYSDSLDAAS